MQPAAALGGPVVVYLLGTAPWRRGPVLLLRRPGVAAALIAAGFVATLPAAAAGPFLSSARNATLHHRIAASCPSAVGVQLHTQPSYPPQPSETVYPVPYPPPPAELTGRMVAEGTALSRVPGFGAPRITLYGRFTGPPTGPGERFTRLTLMSRTGFADQVRVTAGPRGTGAWVSSQYAAAAGLSVGDVLRVGGVAGGSRPVAFPVAAIYRDLRELPDSPYWCGVRDVYRGPPGSELGSFPPPPLVLVDHDALARAAQQVSMAGNQLVDVPVTDPKLDFGRASRLSGVIRPLQFRLTGDYPEGLCCSALGYHTSVVSRLPTFTGFAGVSRTALLTAVVPITAAGILVGLVVVAATALFWVQRRRQELLLLSAHGVSAGALGLKAIAEALPALLLGVLGGWLVTWVLVKVVGPDPVLSAEAAPLALLGTGASLVLAVLVTGTVAALGCRPLTDQLHTRRHAVLRSVPWELLVLAAAPLAWVRLGGARNTTDLSGSVVHLPARLLAVPIMVVTGLTVLAARLAVLRTSRLRRRGRHWTPGRPALFLGWRRLGRDAVITAVLAAATAMPIALTGYGLIVNGSVRATISAEARLSVGADVVVTLDRPVPVPASLAGQTTEVLRVNGVLIDGVQTDLLAVDPASFARNAFWTRQLGDPLARILSPLRANANAVATFPLRPGSYPVRYGGGTLIDSLTITSADTLPAEHGGYPVAVIRADALPDREIYRVPQLWMRGDPDRIVRVLAAEHLPIRNIEFARDQYAETVVEPLTYTFDYLGALCLVTGLVTLVGLVLYLESRAPRRRRAYVLLRRMSLPPGSHRRALLTEIGVPVFAGLLGGFVLTTGLTAVLSPEFEVNPAVPPGTVVDVPYPAGAAITGAVFVVAVVAVWYAQHRISRARPSEVLRDAG
jgi:putative ABC transport system permease protein